VFVHRHFDRSAKLNWKMVASENGHLSELMFRNNTLLHHNVIIAAGLLFSAVLPF